MLEIEGKSPNQIALQKPTAEVSSFIEHVFGLSDQVYPPANGFIVFNAFFDENKAGKLFAKSLMKTKISSRYDQIPSQ